MKFAFWQEIFVLGLVIVREGFFGKLGEDLVSPIRVDGFVVFAEVSEMFRGAGFFWDPFVGVAWNLPPRPHAKA